MKNVYLPSLFTFISTASYSQLIIVPRSSNVVTGSIIINLNSDVNIDITAAAPWGTVKIDPSHYASTSPIACIKSFESILSKSGSYDRAQLELISFNSGILRNCRVVPIFSR